MMGHNVVIASTEDYQAVVNGGMKAGLTADFVDSSDNRVIAHTKIIGGGEKTSVTFPGGRLKPGGDYKFFCTSPGHVSLMRGQVIVK
jgi:azurin